MKRLPGAIPEHIARRVAGLHPLDAALRASLPTDCAAHCRSAGIHGDTLHIVADSPAWRARIQLHSRSIINEINRLGNSRVQRVSIRVGRPDPPQPAPRARGARRTIPAEAARGFASLARVTSDPGLRDALERLSQRGAQR